MAATIELKVAGTLDPDAMLFALCMEHAARFQSATFSEFASRVEAMVEIYENVGVQRMMPESEEAHG